MPVSDIPRPGTEAAPERSAFDPRACMGVHRIPVLGQSQTFLGNVAGRCSLPVQRRNARPATRREQRTCSGQRPERIESRCDFTGTFGLEARRQSEGVHGSQPHPRPGTESDFPRNVAGRRSLPVQRCVARPAARSTAAPASATTPAVPKVTADGDGFSPGPPSGTRRDIRPGSDDRIARALSARHLGEESAPLSNGRAPSCGSLTAARCRWPFSPGPPGHPTGVR